SNSMLGFMTRIRIKVLAYNISFFISKVMSKDESIAKIKELIFG
ncbi:TPA: IS982 family transposase, partial [Clostridioides difficile]